MKRNLSTTLKHISREPSQKKVTSASPQATSTGPSLCREKVLRNLVDSFAKNRAILLLKGPQAYSRLQRETVRFEKSLKDFTPLLSDKPELLDQLSLRAKEHQIHSVCQRFSDRMQNLGEKIGYLHGRNHLPVTRRKTRNRVIYKTTEKIANALPEFIDPGLSHTADKSIHDDLEILPQWHWLESAPVPEPDHSPFNKLLEEAVLLGEQKGVQKQLELERMATTLYEAIGGIREKKYIPIFSDIHKFREIVGNLSDRDREMLINMYQERYNTHLHDTVTKVFRGTDQLLAKHILSGNRAGVRAHDLYRTISGMHFKETRSQRVLDLYFSLESEEIQQMEKILRTHYLPRLKTRNYGKILEQKLHPGDLEVLQLLAKGERDKAVATEVKKVLEGPKRHRKRVGVMFSYFENGEEQQLVKSFQECFNIPLEDFVKKQLKECAAREFILNTIRGDRDGVCASTLRCAIDYHDYWVGDPFLHWAPRERDAAIELYTGYHCDGSIEKFKNKLKKACDYYDIGILSKIPFLTKALSFCPEIYPNSHQFVESIRENGKLSHAEMFRYFMVGPGTDDNGILQLLRSLTFEQLEEARKDYRRRYPPGPVVQALKHIPGLRHIYHHTFSGDLDRDILAETSGSNQFRAKRLLEGSPQNCQQLYAKTISRIQHEESGKFMRMFRGKDPKKKETHSFLNPFRLLIRLPVLFGPAKKLRERITKEATPALRLLDADNRAFREFYDREILNPTGAPLNKRLRLYLLARRVELNYDSFEKLRCGFSKLTENMAGGLGTTAGMIFAWAIASPLSLIPAAIAGSITFRYLLVKALDGKACGREQVAGIALRGTAEGGTLYTMRAAKLGAFTARAVGALLGRSLSRTIMKSGVKTALHKVAQSLEHKVTKQNKLQHFVIEEDDPFARFLKIKKEMKSFLKRHQECEDRGSQDPYSLGGITLPFERTKASLANPVPEHVLGFLRDFCKKGGSLGELDLQF